MLRSVPGSPLVTRSLIACILLALVVDAGCTRGPSRDVLRVGINHWPGYAFLFLAEDLGYFEDAGVDVRLVEFDSLPNARRAFQRGQVDALATTLIDLVSTRQEGTRELQLVYVADFSDGADVIVARPGIESVAALAGKRVGLEEDSLGTYMLGRALEEAGLGFGDVERVPSTQLRMTRQLLSGEVDAIVCYPPVSLEALESSGGNVLFDSREIPREILDILAVDASWARHESASVQALVQSYIRAYQYYTENPTDALERTAPYLGMTTADFYDALHEGIRLVPPSAQREYLGPGGPVARAIERTLTLSHETDDTGLRPRIDDYFTDQFLEASRD